MVAPFMRSDIQRSETARNINAVFGEGSTTKATVGNWFKNFRDGDFSLANEPRGRPKTKVDNDHLRAVVESDPSQNLSPTDYHFFRNLDNLLVGKFFNSQQAVESAFRDFIDSRTPGFYSRGIDQLPLKWQKDGDFSLANEPRGRPKTKVDNDHLRAVVESDPSQSTRELASIFNVSIPTILVHLAAIGKIKKLDKWVPHELTDAQQAQRLEASLSCFPVQSTAEQQL
ncbi:hypothetical protein DMN91_012479 [Ooceraea biroi]|uniref:Mos1 transposase HTH domain-containing protein n=1 Tax=Ooceraea biroi TaxID=2015173 RepID=A0A3L8D4V9_OOCBI|nr:hypothetical protein DMN91_012479 [Ooceraea biroi]